MLKKISVLCNKLKYIFTPDDKKKLLLLVIMAVIGSILELIGVSIFLPFIKIIVDTKYLQSNPILSCIYNSFSFPSETIFEIFFCIVMIMIYVIKNVFLIWQKKVTYRFSFKTQESLAVKLLDAYLREPYTFHLKKNVAELQRTLEQDVANFCQFVMQLLEFVAEITVCAVMGVYLLFLSKTITLAVVGLMIVCVLGLLYLTKNTSKGLGKATQGYKAKIYQWINQSMGGIKEIKILNREDFFLESYTEYYAKYADALVILRLISMIPKYIVEAVCMTGLLAAIIFKILFGQAEMIYFIPQLSVFAVAAFRLMPSVGRINGYATLMLASLPSVELVYEELREVEEIENASLQGEYDPDFKLKDRIRIDNVTYRYEGGTENIVDKVSFEIPKGKMVAFIGTTGAGKTTMADIIIGLLKPVSGAVYADDMDVHKNLKTWHKQIGYIPQTIYLSDDSIRANVAFGVKKEDIDDEAVKKAVKLAQLDSFISDLPEGLDTFVGDRGVRLSGGQRQRIGIARALYHDPEILVLDEATSALDTETETAVMESIDALMGIKTMIVIAHRLTTIENADIVYEVGDGRVKKTQL